MAVCQGPQLRTKQSAYPGILCRRSPFSNTLTNYDSISKNFDTIMTIQHPLKSSHTEFTHEQPLSADQNQALKIHNQGWWPSPLPFCPTKFAFFPFSSRGSEQEIIRCPPCPRVGLSSRNTCRTMGQGFGR